MKHILFLLSFLCCTFIFAQNKSFYKQTYFSSRIEKVLPLPNGQMAYLSVTGEISAYNKSHEVLSVGILDSNMKEIKTFDLIKKPFLAEFLSWRAFEIVGKDSILIGVVTQSCDFPNDKAALAVLNTKTGVLTEYEFDPFDKPKGMVTLKDGTVLLAEKSGYSFLVMKNLDIVGWLPGGDIYFGGAKKVYYFNKNDMYSNSTLPSVFEKKVLTIPDSLQKDFQKWATFSEIKEDSKFAFWFENRLRFLDAKTKKIKSFVLTDDCMSVYYDEKQNWIYAASKSKIMTFDTAFNLLKTEKIEGDRAFFPITFFEVKNTLYMGGATLHYPTKIPNKLSTISTIRPFAYNKPKNDVAIENITYQNNPAIIVKSYDVSMNKTSFVHNINFGDISVKITNTGSDTINSLTINTQHECYHVICYWDIHNNWDFDKLKLAPGESRVVTLPNVTVGSIPKIANDKFCFWASNVNNKPDANPDNDYSCAPFAILVGTDDIVQNDIHTKIFPNPVSNELTVSSDKSPIQNVAIFDLTGRKIFSQIIDNQMNTSFSLQNLPIGMYMILVKKTDGTSVHKVVKE